MNPTATYPFPTLTAQELRLKTYLRVLFFVYFGAIFIYLLPPVFFRPGFYSRFLFLAMPHLPPIPLLK